jgi:hypothetical protein
MAGYGVAERKTARKTKADESECCGSCGMQCGRYEELCQPCRDDIFFTNVCVQIENEKFESGESQ